RRRSAQALPTGCKGRCWPSTIRSCLRRCRATASSRRVTRITKRFARSPSSSGCCAEVAPVSAGARFVLEDVRVAYGSCVALDGIDLKIESGEAVALVGPSGAGKTTLLGLLNGTVRPDRGTVAVDERNLGELSAAALRRVRADIGFIHQDLALVPNLRVLQNVL